MGCFLVPCEKGGISFHKDTSNACLDNPALNAISTLNLQLRFLVDRLVNDASGNLEALPSDIVCLRKAKDECATCGHLWGC